MALAYDSQNSATFSGRPGRFDARRPTSKAIPSRGIGPLLKAWRAQRGHSQMDLALLAEVSTRHLSFVETGRAQPSREMVLRLADVLAVPIADRNALLLAAGYAALYQETTSDLLPLDVDAPETHKNQSGYDFLKSIERGTTSFPPIAALMELGPCDIEKGRVAFSGTPTDAHYTPMGTVHSGYAATLLDASMGSAVHSLLEAGQCYTTLELSVKYVRPLTKNAGPVTAEGRVIHLSRRLATAEGQLMDAIGKLYAHGTLTAMVFSN